jgi:hypothetical protein
MIIISNFIIIILWLPNFFQSIWMYLSEKHPFGNFGMFKVNRNVNSVSFGPFLTVVMFFFLHKKSVSSAESAVRITMRNFCCKKCFFGLDNHRVWTRQASFVLFFSETEVIAFHVMITSTTVKKCKKRWMTPNLPFKKPLFEHRRI